jgi:hypothetical protein
MKLTQNLISQPICPDELKNTPLTPFEADRIIYKGDPEIFQLLLKHLGPNDEIVQNLSHQLNVPLQIGEYLR